MSLSASSVGTHQVVTYEGEQEADEQVKKVLLKMLSRTCRICLSGVRKRFVSSYIKVRSTSL